MHLAWQATAAWLLIAILAMLNGTLREALLEPAVGDPMAAILSVVILGGTILALQAALVCRPWRRVPARTLLWIGIAWAAGAAMFELALGRMLGMSWDSLLQQYNVAARSLWPLVPVIMVVGLPFMKHWMRDDDRTGRTAE